MKLKTCTKCFVEKPLDKFDDAKKKKDGKYPWCKACRTVYYRNRNKDKPKKNLKLGNSELQENMEKLKYLQPYLCMRW